jgi:rRNA-processing protein FCF1
MNEQPIALRLIDRLDKIYLHKIYLEAADELRRLHSLNQELVEALELAVRQNSHDMVMTGDELRTCEAALAKAKGEV